VTCFWTRTKHKKISIKLLPSYVIFSWQLTPSLSSQEAPIASKVYEQQAPKDEI
jgi:hypothetical protein